MRRFFAVTTWLGVVACATAALALEPPHLDDRTPMHADHYGPIKFGMTMQQASIAAGMPVGENPGEKRPSDNCFYAYGRDILNVMFVVEKQKITHAFVYHPQLQTPQHLGVGSTTEQITRTFTGKWKTRENPFSESGNEMDIIVKISDKFGYVFFMKDDHVEYYNAGDFTAIQDIEGC